MPKSTLLDPVVIAQLGNLHLRARRILDGLYTGHHANLSRGTSQEFSEHRAYNPGDDPKSLDWKIVGRTDRLVVKQYEEETNLSGTVLLDDSESMNFAWDGRLTKLDYAKTMAAALAYLLHSQHDAAGLAVGETFLRPNATRVQLDRVCDQLDAVRGHGVWKPKELCGQLGASLKKRGFVFVISDLLGHAEELLAALRVLHGNRHEVIVFQLLDPAERDLPFTGSVVFVDSETQATLRTDADALRAAYRQVVEEKLAHFKHLFQSAGLDYVSLTTDAPFDKGLGAYLSWRAARV